ncbi:MAG: peptidylprolyl isomerase [Gammaproteobacteria bacterium]|uniref:Peptidyl-prolyl cis-trans isomerase n=1 Tax=Candidatus Thiopontia autotrophica TaxID=2841688 RepID=A0A8J6TXZ6_9GAMM|nr:peptidylprolyl isomerase [Candidatus Thiopontia autotrophica]MBL6969188.1 peptidylprolyl isomerase [Gammaproteobacteria bacterium]
MKICKDRVVTIEYKMVDDKGEVIDSTDHSEPLSFIQGHATVLPAIEKQVEGRQAGESITFALDPADSYGERDKSKIQVVPISQFNTEREIHVGMQFFTQKNGHDIPVTITAVSDSEVTIDGNHPLAGADINVNLVIVEVREAVDAELESGEIQTDQELFSQ